MHELKTAITSARHRNPHQQSIRVDLQVLDRRKLNPSVSVGKPRGLRFTPPFSLSTVPNVEQPSPSNHPDSAIHPIELTGPRGKT